MTARIEANANVMLGKPVIRGTRVPVELILRKLGEGTTQGDLLDAYPTLTADKVGLIYGLAAGRGLVRGVSLLVGQSAKRKYEMERIAI